MRKSRVVEQNRCDHLVSRLAHRAFFLDDEEKDRAVALMRRVEEFSGVVVLAYAFMSNHFHIFIYVPSAEEIGEGEILRRIRVLYRDASLSQVVATWNGLQFENLGVNNFRDLVKPLHLEGVPVLSAVPYEKRKRNGQDRDKGLQIDLLVQTRKSVYVVEIKRKRHIGESIEGLSIRTALVYEGELAPVVRGNGYFDAIVSAADLIGL